MSFPEMSDDREGLTRLSAQKRSLWGSIGVCDASVLRYAISFQHRGEVSWVSRWGSGSCARGEHTIEENWGARPDTVPT